MLLTPKLSQHSQTKIIQSASKTQINKPQTASVFLPRHVLYCTIFPETESSNWKCFGEGGGLLIPRCAQTLSSEIRIKLFLSDLIRRNKGHKES